MINLETINQSQLWYLIGLIASDGSLSKDGRHICITSKDEDLLLSIKEAFNLRVNVGKKSGGSSHEKIYSVLQIGDIGFYKYLLAIGLSTNKSLTMGALNIPKKYFRDFLRGEIDGDGCIYSWRHPTNNNRQSSLRIVSAAPVFSQWLYTQIQDIFNVPGKIHISQNKNNPLYNIKFGKIAAQVILKKCYYKDCLCLKRKLVQANHLLKLNEDVRSYKPRWRNW